MATWAVSSEILFKSNAVLLFEQMTAAARTLTETLAALNAEVRAFNAANALMPRAMGRTTGAFKRQTARIDEATAAMERYGVAAKEAGMVSGPRGGGSGAAGEGAAAGASLTSRVGTGLALTAAIASYEGIKGAASLQNSTVQTAIASGRMGGTLDETQANMAPTVELAYKMSAMTGGSVAQMMEVVQQLSTAGLTQAQIATNYKSIAQATDVLHFGKDNMEFKEAATTIAGAMHSLGLYNQADTKFGLQRVVQLGYQSPHGTNQLMTQARLFAPMFERNLQGTTQQKADQILTYTSWMDRMGVLQRGGSGLNMLMTYLQNPKTTPQKLAFQDLGLMDKQGRSKFMDNQGHIDIQAVLEKVSRDYIDAQGKGKDAIVKVNKELNSLSSNASRYFMTLTTPQALEQLRRLQEQTKHMPGLDAMQSQLMDTLTHAFQRLTSNISSLLTTLVMPALPAITNFVGALANATAVLGQFFRDHSTAAKAGSFALLTGGAIGLYQGFKMLTHLFAKGDSVLVREIATKVGAGEAAEGAGAAARTGGVLSGIGDFLFGASALKGTKLAGMFKWIEPLSASLGRLATFARLLIGPTLVAAAALGTLWYLMSHPIQVGKFVGTVEGMFVNLGGYIQTAWAGLMSKMWNTTGKGTTDIVGAFATMFGIIIDAFKVFFLGQFKVLGDLASHNFIGAFNDMKDIGSGGADVWARYHKLKNDMDWANMERDKKFQEGRRKGFDTATGNSYKNYYIPPTSSAGAGPRASLLPTITLPASNKPQPVMVINKDKQQHTIGTVSIVVNSKSDSDVPASIIAAFQSQLGIRVGGTTATSPSFPRSATAGLGHGHK